MNFISHSLLNAEAVQEIRKDMRELKRKRDTEEETPAKKSRAESSKETPQDGPGESSLQDVSESEDSESEEDLDSFMDNNKTEAESQDTLSDLEDFFAADDGTGEALGERMARITEKGLRGKKSKKDEDKLKELRDKHKRPKNIENLQAPK